ncbi:M1 family metallopeptidase [Paenibacillus koleovorans]|uniref:M1 family metallopeptidase n=1 Tax=Paenibacillus koleovorans TaxID=121608 RepID=UPI001FEB29D8|nr:M1 family metallopeptidase [Paenibacillus koleovorans]
MSMSKIDRLVRHPALWMLVLALVFGTLSAAAYTGQSDAEVRAAFSQTAPTGAPQLEPPAPTDYSAPQALSRRIVEYHINVQLDSEQKTLQGAQSFTWENPGSKPVSELYFHLYPNAFQSKKTTFNKESGGKLREDERTKDSYGRMDITSVRTEDGLDLSSTLQFVQPDDGNKLDQTLVKLRLPKPVNPGERTTLKMNFSVQLPYVFARMGYKDDFVMAGQWFPKVAVYEPKGTRGRAEEGWNLHQYHGNSEFYADFGIYNVRIQVPASYTVAATGFPTGPASNDGKKKVYSFYADDVHDFAWAASPDFVYAEEPFSTPNIPGMKIKLYLDPAHKELKDRYMYAAKRALAKYSEWFGTYPYSTLSIVVPPAGAGGAGGMEYPTLVTGWAASEDTSGFDLERVIVHEIGHQYWYGMVASNEFEEAWLDEGFTSYAEDLVMESEFGEKSNLPLESSYMTTPAPLKQDSWRYADHNHYAENVYTRAKLVLKGIENQIGQKQMIQVLHTYFERWRFKHPSTQDFQKTLESVTKTSWSAYFDQFIYGGLMADYSIEQASSKKVKQDGESVYEHSVLVRKLGGAYRDVPVKFQFTDGTSVERVWPGTDEQVLFTVTSRAPLEWAAIDPDHTLILENKRINNFYRTEVDAKWKVRWNIGLVKLIETLVDGIAW